MATLQPQFGLLEPTELLTIDEVELRSKMKRSWIYQLIKLRKFPAPIHLGGSKWVAAEVEEYVRLRIEERDRQNGESKFVPRPRLVQFQANRNCNAPPSFTGVADFVGSGELTLRVLSTELCDALRTLRIAIPELYLDQDTWQVNLLVTMTDRQPAPPTKEGLKRNRKNGGKTKVSACGGRVE